jgi:hypothetical protein
MPRQNRVTQEGDIIAAPWRGGFMGNRGILHDAQGALGPARWRHSHWVTCTLNLKSDRAPHPIAAPGRYTPLFFRDEAMASAAGHRPCAQCRNLVWRDFAAAWARAFDAKACAPEIDRVLHAARITRDRHQIRHQAQAAALPFGAVYLDHAQTFLRSDSGARPFDPATGLYAAEVDVPKREVTVLTPAPLVSVMAQGWRPALGPAEDRPGWPDRRAANPTSP